MLNFTTVWKEFRHICRGAVHEWQTLPNEDTVSSWWYGGWSTPRTCYHFHVLLWDVANPRTTLPFSFPNCISCTSVVIWSFWISYWAAPSAQLWTACRVWWVSMVPLTTFGVLFLATSRQVYWTVFARKVHSTSQFAMTILSKCVCVCVCVRVCVCVCVVWLRLIQE